MAYFSSKDIPRKGPERDNILKENLQPTQTAIVSSWVNNKGFIKPEAYGVQEGTRKYYKAFNSKTHFKDSSLKNI